MPYRNQYKSHDDEHIFSRSIRCNGAYNKSAKKNLQMLCPFLFHTQSLHSAPFLLSKSISAIRPISKPAAAPPIIPIIKWKLNNTEASVPTPEPNTTPSLGNSVFTDFFLDIFSPLTYFSFHNDILFIFVAIVLKLDNIANIRLIFFMSFLLV